MSKRRMVILVGILAVVWSSVAQAFAPQAQAFPLGPGQGDIGLRTTFVMWQGNFPCGVDYARAKFKLRLSPGSQVTFGFEQPAQGVTGPTSTIHNPYDYGMNVTVLPGYNAGASYYVQAQEKPGQFRIVPTTGSEFSVSDVQVWAEGDPDRDCTPWTNPPAGDPLPTARPAPTAAPTPTYYARITPPPDPLASPTATPAPGEDEEYCVVPLPYPGANPLVVPCADESAPATTPSPSPTPADYDYSFACSMTYPAPGDGGNIGCNDFLTAETGDGWFAIDGHTYELTFTFAHTTTYGHNPHADVFATSTGTFPASFEGSCIDGPDFADVNRVCETTYQRVDLDDSLETLSPELYLWCYAWGGPSDSGTCSLTIKDLTPTVTPTPSASASATVPPWGYPMPTFWTPGATVQPTLQPELPPQPPATANPGVNPGQPASGWFYPTSGLGAPPNFGGSCEPSYPKPGQLPAVDMGTAAFPGATLDLSRWLNWIGSILTLLPKAIMNVAITMWNLVVDALIPGTCLDDILGDRVEALMGIGPFALYSDVEEQVNSALADSSGSVPGWCVPLWGGGEYCLPLGEWAAVTSDVRTASGLFVWLLAAIAAIRIVVGSFRVGRGSMHIDVDDPVVYLKGS